MLTNGKLQANRLKIGEKRLVLKVHKMFSIARVNTHLHGSRFINNGFECKIVFFFTYHLSKKYVLGAQHNHLIKTVLLSTHNICFG